jgi:hypothetical protein
MELAKQTVEITERGRTRPTTVGPSTSPLYSPGSFEPIEQPSIAVLLEALLRERRASDVPAQPLAELGQLFAVSRSTAYRVGARLSYDGVRDDLEQVGEVRAPVHRPAPQCALGRLGPGLRPRAATSTKAIT